MTGSMTEGNPWIVSTEVALQQRLSDCQQTAVAGVLFTGISMAAYQLEIYHDDCLRDMIYSRQQHGDAEMKGMIHLF